MKYIDLCCGLGGFSYVLQKYNNFENVFSNDFCKESEIIFKHNFKNYNFNNQDLNTIDISIIPKHQLLIAGFPCQSFSIAGQQKGFDDARSNVFFKIIEIIKYHNPEVILFENVKNLISHDNKNTINKILSTLSELEYHLTFKILDTCMITKIPQHRERVFIIGFKNKDYYNKFNFDFSIINNNPINHYLDSIVNDKYYYKSSDKIYNKLQESVIVHINHNKVYQYRRNFIRENKKNKVPTLTSNMGTGGHNVPIILDDYGIRKLTPRECFRLQGFGEDYKIDCNLSDSKLYKLIGNSITVDVVNLIIKKLLNCFDN